MDEKLLSKTSSPVKNGTNDSSLKENEETKDDEIREVLKTRQQSKKDLDIGVGKNNSTAEVTITEFKNFEQEHEYSVPYGIYCLTVVFFS